MPFAGAGRVRLITDKDFEHIVGAQRAAQTPIEISRTGCDNVARLGARGHIHAITNLRLILPSVRIQQVWIHTQRVRDRIGVIDDAIQINAKIAVAKN